MKNGNRNGVKSKTNSQTQKLNNNSYSYKNSVLKKGKVYMKKKIWKL